MRKLKEERIDMSIRIKVYEAWNGTLAEPLRYDLWKWGLNPDGTFESDKYITSWFERHNGQWYMVSYNDGSPR